ncbi:hypothetical protein [Tautonia rosea]|uniref:hypothetical protein n=1 Tax=Tautonia rosea TaxID=2728037 RepID=UPI0014749547|nr:hypothetical protein [Tautonia rosea]
MPKRIAPNERPYSPVQEALARDVLTRHRDRPDAAPGLAVVEIPAEREEEAPVPGPRAEAVEAPPAPVSFPAPPPAGAEAQPAPRTAKKRDLTREKRMLLTREEERELDRLIEEISDELGVRVKVSNVMRASVTLLFNVREELAKQCRRAQFSKRPRNSEPTEIANFEENLARLFDSAVRNTRHRD